jgi:hypothetical protein
VSCGQWAVGHIHMHAAEVVEMAHFKNWMKIIDV